MCTDRVHRALSAGRVHRGEELAVGHPVGAALAAREQPAGDHLHPRIGALHGAVGLLQEHGVADRIDRLKGRGDVRLVPDLDADRAGIAGREPADVLCPVRIELRGGRRGLAAMRPVRVMF